MMNQVITEQWTSHKKELEVRLIETFTRYAIDNSGRLTSTKQATAVSQNILALTEKFIIEQVDDEVIKAAISELAKQGLSIKTSKALMNTLGTGDWIHSDNADISRESAQAWLSFQLLFLETLSEAHRILLLNSQERSQRALQDALHSQIDQQRQLRHTQEAFATATTKILELNAKLASIASESQLLVSAVSGICESLDLADVTFYKPDQTEQMWSMLTTTSAALSTNPPIPAENLMQLGQLSASQNELITVNQLTNEQVLLSMSILFQTGNNRLGAMIANSNPMSKKELQEHPLLLRTFAQSLSAQWQNLRLLQEANQRNREMEILYGRYIDNIWNSNETQLRASLHQNQLSIQKQDMSPVSEIDQQTFPLLINEHPVGEVIFPKGEQFTSDETEFAQSIIREMSNALNNAYLLQTTRTTSNQLNLATEVSRAASTILDLNILINEVVNLIQSRFGYYYVGLFLVGDTEETAVLRAGTGEAGKQQLVQNHNQIIGGPSMIGTSIYQNKPIIEQDVTQASAFKYNPLLPKTKSELALPLRSRNKVIGALTVQSNQTGIFTTETIAILQSLADQLAIAIENVTLFTQTQATLAETSRLYNTSRQINEASASLEIYKALIEYAQQDENIQAAQIFIKDPGFPEYLRSPVWWSNQEVSQKPKLEFIQRIPAFEQQLQEKDLISFNNTSPPIDDNNLKQLLQQFQTKSAAFVMLEHEGSLNSIFALYSNSSLNQEELQPFKTIADQAAATLSNQKLFEEVTEANNQLRQLDQLKTQFLANMSHELRTPLNSIIGFSRVILKGIDGPITQEQEEDLTSIHNNGNHLLALINEILDMAKIEAGKMALTFEKVNIENSARDVFNSTRTLVAEGVELIWEVEENLPEIEADQIRIRQILTNLLSNAAKFTKQGHIRLQIERDKDTHLHICVKDTGIGIAPKQFDTLFRAFEQVDNSTTRKVGGTGLGLPITKWIINMHQGTIWVESGVDKGTAMHVKMPIKLEQTKTPDIAFAEIQPN